MAGGSASDEAWLAVLDAILPGLHHDLKNRVAAVSAYLQLAAVNDGPRGELHEELRIQTSRFDEPLRLLRLLPRAPHGEPIPLLLADVLAEAVALAHYHRDLRDLRFEVEGEAGVSPLLAPEDGLRHALLLLLAGVGRAARAAGERTVSVRCEGDERRVGLVVRLPEEGAGLTHEGAVEEAFAALGGEAAREPERYVVRLPTLQEARRRA